MPHEVPVAKDSRQATKKMITGRKFARLAAAPLMRSATKYFAPISEVMFFSEVAKVRIRIEGTIARKPLGTLSIVLLKSTTLRRLRKTIVNTSAIRPPHGSPTVASVSAKASTKDLPSKMPPT